jgi:hypothetical protein
MNDLDDLLPSPLEFSGPSGSPSTNLPPVNPVLSSPVTKSKILSSILGSVYEKV